MKYLNKLYTVVGLLILNFISNAQPLDNTIVADKIIAKVDDEIVLMSDLDVAYIQALSSSRSVDNTELKCAVFESLIVNKMLLAKSITDSVIVDDAIIDGELERRMDYFISQAGSKERLEEYYDKPIDKIKSDLRMQLSDQLTIQKMQESISSGVKVTPGDVKKFYKDIPSDSLPYFSTEVEVGQIVIEPQISKSQKVQTRKALNEIRERILAGENFAELARQYSQDPGSGSDGGELGFFNKGDLVPEYEATALALKPGELSEVIESQFGFHIIELIEKRGDEYNSRHILFKPESSELDISGTVELLDSLKNEIIKGTISFEKAAKEYSIDKKTTATGGLLFDSESNSTRMSLDKLDPNMFFRLDTMEVGDFSEPLVVREGDKELYRIIWYKSKKEPHQANLDDDYQKIALAALNDKRSRKLNDWFNLAKKSVYIDVDEDYSHCKLLD